MRASQHPEAAFLAKMTASATHEVRNVLAIIKESAGLIEDMVHASAKRGPLDQEKVFRTVSRIDTQVKRGADLLTNLNRLSHTLDQDLATLELHKEVEQVVFLSQRFARKKGHRVVALEEHGGEETTVHPLRLHMALFAAMECCLLELPEGAAITLSVTRKDEAPVVSFHGVSESGEDVKAPSDGESWTSLASLAESLGGRLERSETGFEIRVLLPPRAGG